MKFEMSNFQALAANLPVQGEVCDLPCSKLSTQADADVVTIPSLIEKVGATTIAEIDRLLAELQEAKNYLQWEGERIEQETVRYTKLAQMALFSAKIIFDAISQWHPASNQQNATDVTVASTEESIGAFRKCHHSQSDGSELGQAADATEGDDS